MLPESQVEPLQRYQAKVREIHEAELRGGFGEVLLSYALARKYLKTGREWAWQYVFPSSQRSMDPYSGIERRHHLDEEVPQRAVKHGFATRGCQSR